LRADATLDFAVSLLELRGIGMEYGAINRLPAEKPKEVLAADFGKGCSLGLEAILQTFLWTTQTTLGIIVHNGSCFFLALDGNLYLITAAHVYTGFLKAKEKFGDRIACRVGHIPFDPKVHLRDHDKHRDIAIFNYAYEELAKIDRKQALAPARWPPPEPICGLPVFLGALCQINLSQSKKPEAGRAITPPRLRSAIRSPPRLGRSAASIATRDGVEG
jgi:hypothetical protein